MIIIGGIIIILWGSVGGFDWIPDSYDCLVKDCNISLYKDIKNNLNQIKQLQQVVLLQENLIDQSLEVLIQGEAKIKSDAKILEGAFRVINNQKHKIEMYEFIFQENNIKIEDFYKK